MVKYYFMLVVSYESGGGHGDADAHEEGLKGRIEKPTIEGDIAFVTESPFKVEFSESLTEDEAKELIEEDEE